MDNTSPWKKNLMAEKQKLAARGAELDGELERITALEKYIQVGTEELRVASDNINAKEKQHIKDVEIEENALKNKAALISAAERNFAAAVDKVEKAYDDVRAATSGLYKLREEFETQEETSRKVLAQLQKNIDCDKSSLASKKSELEQQKEELQRLKENFAVEKVANEDPSTACLMQANLARVEGPTEQQRDFKDERPVEEVVHTSSISESVSEDAPEQCGRASTVAITSPAPAADARDDVLPVHYAVERSRASKSNTPPYSDVMPIVPGANTILASLIDMAPSKDVGSFEAVVSGSKTQQGRKSQAPVKLPMMGLDRTKYKLKNQALHQTHRLVSEPVANPKQKALGHQEASIRAASEMPGCTQATIKVETKSRAPVSVKKQQGPVYGQETDECSLSARYSHIVYVAKYAAWCELKCFVCGANSVKGENQYFAGIRGLVQHISSHGSCPRDRVVEACSERKLTPEHAQRLLSDAVDKSIEINWGEPYKRMNRLRDGVIVPADGSVPDAARSMMLKSSATTSLKEKIQTTSSVVEPCDSDDELLQHTGSLRSRIKKESTGDLEDEWSDLTVHHT